MVARARVFEYDVTVNADWAAHSTRGGAPILVRALVEAGERDCFVSASLTAKPTYRSIADGNEIS